MNLESPKVTANKNQQEMFEFLTNVENYEQLMPESKEKFKVLDQETFLFALKGMPEIKLKIQETEEPKLVVLGSTSDKLNFSLNIHIDNLNKNKSENQLFFHGKFNAMMSMMVKSPLQKFINSLAENIAKV
ncbi:SRPBCC family protein [Autumnicola psychrophila]|uniref:SRPBCC family protein n=1 Tax=Autumnicola psychrophila TaxID=3075592 RepID=A0ABU3DSN9_9FLAO|nr:SRPBCC family protein [Zunongwangia sp. F225]MDT0686097.1 SRPBCC family protein [Zunongwangia sp. F225]